MQELMKNSLKKNLQQTKNVKEKIIFDKKLKKLKKLKKSHFEKIRILNN